MSKALLHANYVRSENIATEKIRKVRACSVLGVVIALQVQNLLTNIPVLKAPTLLLSDLRKLLTVLLAPKAFIASFWGKHQS